MNRKSIMVCVLGGLSSLAIAQTTPSAPESSAPAAAPQAAPNSQPAAKPQAEGTAQSQQQVMALPATLAKSVDSKKVKAGDEIDAKLSISLTGPSGTKIPEGSKIVGHISDAKAKGKGDPESSLAFAFEKIVLKNGQEMPLKAVPQAIGAGTNAAAAAFPDSGGPGAAGGAPSGGGSPSAASGSSAGGHSGASAGSSGPSSGGSAAGAGGGAPGAAAPNGQLPDNATGVVGLKGLNLTTQASAAVVSSDSKSVKLDEGTQLLLRVLPQ